ncbi:unnamed protein product [Rangifer tarandus platyrhynchus]|uniref:Uncharacterized protein n=2 Tax=Rangifer tarandus platyrhynchus TaxID=3082113 RepID=A0ACB0DWV5_RANTA|nr:unnamed protein product [Rangifer tarandus platyrhynchus]
MRPLLVLLLLAMLCTDLAQALQCEPLVECAPPDKYCVITRAASPSGVLVMKSCAPTCPNSTVTSDGVALSVSCCQDSQCQSSAAAGLRGGPGSLGATAAASLLWALLRAAC